MISGGCLCGGIRFSLKRVVGPFELCHCRRCRKVSGSAFAAAVGVRREDYQLHQGAELMQVYEAPMLNQPPLYKVNFCKICACTVPPAAPKHDWFEVAAGLLDGELSLTPDKHIYIECKASWWDIADSLPQLDPKALAALRNP